MPELVISGWVICIGSVTFLGAAFASMSRVFGARDPDQKLTIINASPGFWRLFQALFGAGAIITALGAGLFSYALRWPPDAWDFLPAVLLLAGAIPWCAHVYLRAIDPQAFVAGALPAWHFKVYTFFTLAGFFLLGIDLLDLFGGGQWQGFFLMGASVVILSVYNRFKAMPPFVFYILGLILGSSIIMNA